MGLKSLYVKIKMPLLPMAALESKNSYIYMYPNGFDFLLPLHLKSKPFVLFCTYQYIIPCGAFTSMTSAPPFQGYYCNKVAVE